jgi:hypothetical protein
MADDLIIPNVYAFLEKTTGRVAGVIVGNDGLTPISAASLLTLTLTLYVIKGDGTTAFVNGRNHQNVLNLNNVTVDTNGNLVWSVQVADTTLVEAVPIERHVALWEWTTTTVSGKHEIVLAIQNLVEVS